MCVMSKETVGNIPSATGCCGSSDGTVGRLTWRGSSDSLSSPTYEMSEHLILF